MMGSGPRSTGDRARAPGEGGHRPGCGRPGSTRPAPELVDRWTRLGGGAGWRLRRAGGGSLDRVRSAADADGEVDGDARGAVGVGRDDVQRELAGGAVLEGASRGEGPGGGLARGP